MSVTASITNAPAYVTNAKYEEFCCKAIKPSYDGTEEDLMPFLLRLDIQRQDEGWAPATYIKIDDATFDLTTEFSHVTESQVTTLTSK
jgi:hypothetical protein